MTAATDIEANKALIADFWDDLYRRDFDAVASYFTEDGQYTDVFTPDDDMAVGAEQIAARLRLGIEPLESFSHHPWNVIAEGNMVCTEHSEEWHWHTGEEVIIRFASIHVIDGGAEGGSAEGGPKITRWWDYPDLQKLLGAAPEWWIEHIMKGYT